VAVFQSRLAAADKPSYQKRRLRSVIPLSLGRPVFLTTQSLPRRNGNSTRGPLHWTAWPAWTA